MLNVIRSVSKLVLLSTSLLILSCKDDATEPIATPPVPEPEPAVLNRVIVKSLTPSEGTAIDLFVKPQITFNFSINRPISLSVGTNTVKYRPVLDPINFGGVTLTHSWNKDSTQLNLLQPEALVPNKSYTLVVTTHWEHFVNNAWKVVSWNGSDLKEVKEAKFSTASMVALPIENIEYTYPIANQYHFLISESLKGFIKLKIGQGYLFESGYENWIEFSTPTTSIKEPIVYNNKLLTFNIPQTLQSETIYKLKFVNKNIASTTQTILLEFAIRTSKFKTFLEKVNSIRFDMNAFRALHVPWQVHYLANDFTSGEYFDDFELQTGKFGLKVQEATYQGEYCNNLLEFEAVIGGNAWYDDKILPIVYSPWTDPSFKPQLSRDTTLVGYKPKKAMHIYAAGVRLTQSLIDSNNAPTHQPSGFKRFIYNTAIFCYSDFLDYQQQVVAKYISQQNIPQRESKLVWGQFPLVEKGNYKFRVKYRLPDGKITSISPEIILVNVIG